MPFSCQKAKTVKGLQVILPSAYCVWLTESTWIKKLIHLNNTVHSLVFSYTILLQS